nr:zinc-binding alcohol dehydrogenase family protein [uncultured Cupriavidus sp.]
MRAVVLHNLGEAPRFTTFHDPEPRDGEVLVRVGAAVLRPVDIAISRGEHPRMPLQLPYICGHDGIGYLAGGQRVYFRASRSPFGAMAEYVPAEWVVPVPDGVDTAQAAALVGPALTAWMPLAVRADLEPGETVLVLGASGVVGRLAVQAARLQGAGRVIAAGHRIDLLTPLGADGLIDLGQAPSVLQHAFASCAADGIDVVLDFVWGETLELLLSALIETPGSPALSEYRGIRVVSVVDRAAGSVMIAPTALRDSRAVLMGCGPANHPPAEGLMLLVEEILACMRSGHLVLETEQVPMADVATAWRQTGEPERRIVLTLD